ncbi:hypothetical protein PHYPSEUDO_006521 [Phytophthora pseudosyringae]|uniref:Uncharacterized protein n=1 Tax=Phytophthora pseudosyringae TaxID=221518 RepID=A0A8T1VLK6_9STRA|nr:hypothetical protein PHYPSEUDO_006521 [Phytophthora pseudosyringae]
MAARVTKLFLQNCASAKVATSKATKNKSKASESSATTSKDGRRKLRQKSKKVSDKSKVKVLEQARRELEQADRTADNLRKLKNKTSTKSQRLMAKVRPCADERANGAENQLLFACFLIASEQVLAQRTAAFR